MTEIAVPLMRNPYKHGSASQFETFASCEMKWFFEKIRGFETPAGDAAILGKKVHDALENFSRHGIEPNPETKEGKIALQGIEFLPDRSEFDLHVEEGFHTQIGSSAVPVKGFIDLYWRDGDRLTILDHKTTSSKRWMKSKAELSTNTQLVTYAQYAFENLTDSDKVTVSHVYYGTKSKFSERIDVEMERETTSLLWANIEARIERMVELSTKDESDCRKNFEACGMYGGCPHRTRCFGETNTKEKNVTQRLLDDLLKRASAPETPKEKVEDVLNKVEGVLNKVEDVLINPPSDEEVIPITEPSVVENVTVTQPKKKSVKPQTSGKKRVLFIRAYPSKDIQKIFGEVTNYSDIVAPYQRAVCEQYDVPHISLAGQYGDGYKQVAALVAQQGWSLDTPCIYVNPMRSKGAEHILDVLVALADIVVEGV